MKKCISVAIAAIALGVSTNASAAICITEQRISAVGQGYVANASRNPDNGKAIYVTFENGPTVPVNIAYNLDNNTGLTFHRTLMTAMLGGQRVTTVDNHGHECNDFDELWIAR